MSVRTRPVVGVMGSGREPHRELAEPLGSWIAEAGYHLLTGGGGGVMASVAQAFCEVEGRRGVSLGILPGGVDEAGYVAPFGYPSPWVELTVRTHLPYSGDRGTDPLSRNHVNVLTSDVVVALPGSDGTASEVRLARTYGRPLIAYLGADGTIPELPEDVPIARELDAVCAFVVETLG